MASTLRLIVDGARSATLNMAIDEYLMESQSAVRAFPVLRFYSWSSPAFSVGYFQNPDEISKRFRCGEKKIPVVRRLTGGGLVKHGEDLTFSLSLPHPNSFLSGDVKASYLAVNEALRIGLLEIYPRLDYADCKSIPSGRGGGDRVCFENPSCYDLLLDGKKVVGSSQRRAGASLLHQSSVFLKAEKTALIRLIVAGFKRKWGVDFNEMPLSAEELEKCAVKEEKRYSMASWHALEDKFV